MCEREEEFDDGVAMACTLFEKTFARKLKELVNRFILETFPYSAYTFVPVE